MATCPCQSLGQNPQSSSTSLSHGPRLVHQHTLLALLSKHTQNWTTSPAPIVTVVVKLLSSLSRIIAIPASLISLLLPFSFILSTLSPETEIIAKNVSQNKSLLYSNPPVHLTPARARGGYASIPPASTAASGFHLELFAPDTPVGGAHPYQTLKSG